MDFQPVGRRRVEGDFDAGPVSSDGGALLLGETDRRSGLLERLAKCFSDFRDPVYVEHPVVDLLRQRIYGLCLGYEDLNDHDSLRGDAVLAAAIGKRDPEGMKRRERRDRGHALAGKSTLNRLECGGPKPSRTERYKRIVANDEKIERFFVDEFARRHEARHPPRLVLDFDATDIRLHGNQESRFYHGYYDNYCYLPLLVFCGDDLLLARLRPANIDGSAGTVEVLQWLVPVLREHFPDAEIVLRGDSGFARDHIFSWCEENGVEYVIGLARNPRLLTAIEEELAQAKELCAATGQAARLFADFGYRTLDSWSRERRVVAKAEHLTGKSNPRFVVTSYSSDRFGSQVLYEREYCQRGEAENRIKEHQLDLFGDRASCTKMRANQIRLWFSAAAYTLMLDLRRTGLTGTELARAQTGTIRTRLLKVGALVWVSVRRVRVAFSSAFPKKHVFRTALVQLQAAYAPP